MESTIFPGEKEVVEKTIEYGEIYGYGNLMAWLARAWADKLIKSGLDEKTAEEAVSNRSPYPRGFKPW